MESNSISVKELKDKIQPLLKSKEEIILAYLYGSFITEEWTNKSDIDIGILITERAKENHWYSIQLQDELNDLFNNQFKFDIRILNGRSVKFLFNVIFRTPKLFIREENSRVNFETRIMLMWYDQKPTWDRFYKEQSEVLRIL